MTTQQDKSTPEFTGLFTDISQAPTLADDPFQHPRWVDYNRQKFLDHAHGLEAGAIPDIQLPLHYAFVYQYAMLVSLIAKTNRSVSILDFGGGFGEIYPLAVCQLDPEEIPLVYYAVVDNENQCRAADSLSKTNDTIKNISHHTSIDSVRSEIKGKLDICFLSSVMQYLLNWKQVLQELAVLSPKYFLFTRFLTTASQTFFTTQNIAVPSGQCGQTLCQVINTKELKSELSYLGYESIVDNTHMPEMVRFDFQENNNPISISAEERTLLYQRKTP